MRISDWSSDVCSSDLAGDVADDTPLREWQMQKPPTARGSRSARRSPQKSAARKTSAKRRGRDPFPQEVGLQLARLAARAPSGDDWVHALKYDGYRFIAIRENRRVRVVLRTGIDCNKSSDKPTTGKEGVRTLRS